MKLSIFNHLVSLEDDYMTLSINQQFPDSDLIDTIEKINANLAITGDLSLASLAHENFIDSLIWIYLNKKFPNQTTLIEKLIDTKESIVDFNQIDISINELPTYIEALHIAFINSEFSIIGNQIGRKKSKLKVKENGAVYTLDEITEEIVKTTIANCLVTGHNIKNLQCLDFACGTGRFYLKAFQLLREYRLDDEHILSNQLYAIDIDGVAINILKCFVLSQIENLTESIVDSLTKNLIQRNALISPDGLFEEEDLLFDFQNDFKNVAKNGGFDVVFSNPPYCLLKVNKKTLGNKDDYYSEFQNRVQKEVFYFRNSGIYSYAIEGMLNYYQISIEKILALSKKGGQIGIICPASLFADLTSSKLRKHLLTANNLKFIRYYPESAKLFESVAQSTVIFYLEKAGVTKDIEVEIDNEKFKISLGLINDIFRKGLEIPLIDKVGWSILSKISRIPKLGDHKYLRNRRGELDLTLFKSCITDKETGWRLVRGNMVKNNGIVDKNKEYVEIENFLSKKSEEYKKFDFNRERLVCQQISNIDLEKRLKFVLCSKNDVIGNSCNYIVSTRSEQDLQKLHYILNSSLLNWRFKITSGNNHVNNYELDELPLLNLDNIDLGTFNNDFANNDEQICKLYGLDPGEIEYVLKRKLEFKTEYQYETV